MSLDDQLRALTAPPPTADPVGRVLARANRQRRVRASGAAAIVAAVAAAVPLVLQALTPDHRAVPSVTVPVVPWKLALAGDTGSAPVLSTPQESSCTTEQLTLAMGPVTEANQVVGATLTLTNSGADCSMSYRGPAVAITTGAGEVVPALPTLGDLALRVPSTRLLRHGSSATTLLYWGNWCGGDAGQWRIGVTLRSDPEQLSVVAPKGSPSPTCTRPAEKSLVGAGDVTVLNAFGQPADDPQKGLTQSLTADPSVRLGDVLHLTLHLANDTRGRISLTPCPQLGISFGRGSEEEATSPALLLNCGQAPDAIEPGHAIDVQLELPVLASLGGFFHPSRGVAPGSWQVHAGIVSFTQPGVTVEVLPEAPVVIPATCAYAPVPGAKNALAPPAAIVSDLPESGTISTTRGDLGIAFEPGSPCAVAALLSLQRQGFWDDVPATRARFGTFKSVVFQHLPGAGYAFYSELSKGTRYPAGTVLLRGEGGVLSSPDELEITYGDIAYPPEFTVVGHLTSGVDVIAAVGESSDGRAPARALAITGIVGR
jgi:hypothetical protein